MARIINLNGGQYIANITGDYVQGQNKKSDTPKDAPAKDKTEDTTNTHGGNYTENLRGKIINGDVYE